MCIITYATYISPDDNIATKDSTVGKFCLLTTIEYVCNSSNIYNNFDEADYPSLYNHEALETTGTGDMKSSRTNWRYSALPPDSVS